MQTTETTNLSKLTLEELKEEPKKEMAGIRMSIPTPLDNVIMGYQAAKKADNPEERKMTKEHIIWEMMVRGAEQIQKEAVEIIREIDEG